MALAAGKSSAPSFKSILNTPCTLKWPELQHQFVEKFSQHITSEFTDTKLPSLRNNKTRPQAEGSCEIEFNKDKRSQVVIGLNAVTRALERDSVRAVMVCLSVKPAVVNHHIMMLAATKRCPAIALPHLSKTISPLLGVTSALAVAFKKLKEAEKDYFKLLITQITEAPPITIPWLTQLLKQTSDNKETKEDSNKNDKIN